MKLKAAMFGLFVAMSSAFSAVEAQTVQLDGFWIVAKPETLRFNEMTELEMVWQVTDESGVHDRRIGVSGCGSRQGELIFLDSHGAREYHEVLEWYGDEDDALADIGRATCEIASRM